MRRTKSEAVGDLIRQFLRQQSLEAPLNEYRLIQGWEHVMGPIIARYTKDIVIRIFREFLKDSNLKKIAKGLQNDQIITPGQYLYQKYGYVHSGVDITDPYRWSSTTIRSILRNQDYIGNTVNCKTKIKSFKVKKQIRLPKEEWLIFENTHEALVSKADFETAQLILDGRNRPDKSGRLVL